VTEPKPKITVVGSINMDLVIQVERIPRPGETLRGTSLNLVPGGKGANQAVAAARLGAESRFAGKVGDDAFGSQLRDQLQADGVLLETLEVQPRTSSGVALIHVSSEGENSISIVGGANACVGPDDVSRWARFITESDLILMQLEIPIETVLTVSRLARQHRIPIILDPAPPPSGGLPPELYGVEFLTPNQTEAELLTGRPATSPSQAEEAGRALLERGVNNVIIKLGAQGALLLSREERCVHVPSFPLKAIDSTAAGDAFNAAMGVALASGRPIHEAIRWGCAAGALAVTRRGAQTSMPTREELQNLMSKGHH